MQQLGSYQAVDGVARDTSKDRLLLRRCRDKLTAHIERRTGIKLEPGNVRLVMKQSDAYTWTYTKEVAHLFSRELEDHEPEAYQKLCREVGRSFHAITFSKGDFAGGHLRSGSPPPYGIPTFDADVTERGGTSSFIRTSSFYDGDECSLRRNHSNAAAGKHLDSGTRKRTSHARNPTAARGRHISQRFLLQAIGSYR
ncbi:hypothetical protein FPOA_12654 [Fusarium poae]|uniref:Uncharacterized protein n=1 Tax=Fusarium poae TaxID=36050 RepID=A0A1B8A8B5_FUSPO|nr:hypothetical protein FPOA_12979 [Fusarium poae]OBS16709.1 hypothetical protein FPOA_12654 [Fusarium poae]